MGKPASPSPGATPKIVVTSAHIPPGRAITQAARLQRQREMRSKPEPKNPDDRPISGGRART